MVAVWSKLQQFPTPGTVKIGLHIRSHHNTESSLRLDSGAQHALRTYCEFHDSPPPRVHSQWSLRVYAMVTFTLLLVREPGRTPDSACFYVRPARTQHRNNTLSRGCRWFIHAESESTAEPDGHAVGCRSESRGESRCSRSRVVSRCCRRACSGK
jgi:hypothetical protein